MSYTIGFTAALLETVGSFKAAQWLYSFGRPGRRADGYDAAHAISPKHKQESKAMRPNAREPPLTDRPSTGNNIPSAIMHT